MKLETSDGRFFSLNVDGYEFPDEELCPTEDNPADEFETGRFLVVSHMFRNPDGEWHASAPTMTTNELARFANWLESIRAGGTPDGGCYFTERELEFTFDSHSNKLIVHVFHDFLPEWNRSDQTVTIEFSLDDVNLDAAIDSVRQQLAAFPGRPPLRQRDRTTR